MLNDSHTHLILQRAEKKFIDKINGLSYPEIAQGGNIKLCQTFREHQSKSTFEESYKKLSNLIKLGTGSIEIKSGYGLALEEN